MLERLTPGLGEGEEVCWSIYGVEIESSGVLVQVWVHERLLEMEKRLLLQPLGRLSRGDAMC